MTSKRKPKAKTTGTTKRQPSAVQAKLRQPPRRQTPSAPKLPSEEVNAFFIVANAPSPTYPPPTERAGKWLLFIPRDTIDSAWVEIIAALRDRRLGDSIKVSTARPNPNSADPDKHVICVYTYDSDDVGDVKRIRAALRELGFERPIAYKTDRATREGQNEVRGGNRISKYYE